MPQYTFPNQRTVVIHREECRSDFLGIKNENWQAAAHDLGAHAFLLYIYLASNMNNYNLALSQAAVTDAIGMPRSTYHDQFNKLVAKGYLKNTHGNTYEFYERPRLSIVSNPNNDMLPHGDEIPTDDNASPSVVNKNPQVDIEINNINIPTNKRINNSLIFSNSSNPKEPKEEGVFIF